MNFISKLFGSSSNSKYDLGQLEVDMHSHLIPGIDDGSPSQYEAQALFNLQVAGYVPILAHYERYPYYFGDFKRVDALRERNIQIQVNLNSLTGHYGPGVKKMAEQLIKNKQVDFLGTDCHRMEHLMMIEQSLSMPIYKQVEALTLKNNSL